MKLKRSLSGINVGYGYGTGELGLYIGKVEFLKNPSYEKARKILLKDFKRRMKKWGYDVRIHSFSIKRIFYSKVFNFGHYEAKIYYSHRRFDVNKDFVQF